MKPFEKGSGKVYGQSPLHVWKMADNGKISICQRCGDMFSYNGPDNHGAIWCSPSPEWIKNNPNDPHGMEQR